MTDKVIPIYKPFIDKIEEDLVNDCMKSTWISSKGAYINKFEEQIKKYIKQIIVQQHQVELLLYI